MRDSIWSGFLPWAVIGGGLLFTACGSSRPAPTESGQEAGNSGGTDPKGSSACSVPMPTACPDPAPRYADVAPIFASRCTSCHSGAPGGPWSLKEYGTVAEWQDSIREDLRDCSMPPPEANIPMTDEERASILTWLRCGAPY